MNKLAWMIKNTYSYSKVAPRLTHPWRRKEHEETEAAQMDECGLARSIQQHMLPATRSFIDRILLARSSNLPRFRHPQRGTKISLERAVIVRSERIAHENSSLFGQMAKSIPSVS